MTGACGAQLFDMHCHLGFFPDAVRLAEALAARGVGCWSMTVTPREYGEQRPRLAEAPADCGADLPAPCGPMPSVRVGAGLHPWWVAHDLAEARAQADALAALVAATPFVGEVGLDFARKGIAAPGAQEAALRTAAVECARAGGRAVSIHAVGKGAAGRALDILEDARFFADGSNCAVFHWFSGSSDELVRARDLGCRFSVGLPMLRSKRGRAYAAQIPEAQLLLETDLPQRPEGCDAWGGDAAGSMPQSPGVCAGGLRGELPAEAVVLADAMERQLTETLEMLAAVRNEEPGRLAHALRCSSRQVLGRR